MSKRRSYVRLPDQVLREPWDDATLADMVRLQCWLNTRWARDRLTAEEAGRAFLGPQEMMTITRTSNATRARRRLLSLPDRCGGVTLAVTEATPKRGSGETRTTRSAIKGVNIHWPKFPYEQGYYDRERPKLGRDSEPPLPPPLPPPQGDKRAAPEAPAAPINSPAPNLQEPTAQDLVPTEESVTSLLGGAQIRGSERWILQLIKGQVGEEFEKERWLINFGLKELKRDAQRQAAFRQALEAGDSKGMQRAQDSFIRANVNRYWNREAGRRGKRTRRSA